MGPGAKLGLIGATALVMGNMIGSGVFLLPASLAPYGWNGVVGWVATIAGTLVLAWVLAQLTRARPEAVDPSGFVAEAFGELPSFLVSWVYWVSVWTAVVSIAVAGISYLTTFIPAIATTPMLPAILTVALIWAMTLVNLRGVQAAGNFQILTVLLKLLPLIAVGFLDRASQRGIIICGGRIVRSNNPQQGSEPHPVAIAPDNPPGSGFQIGGNVPAGGLAGAGL